MQTDLLVSQRLTLQANLLRPKGRGMYPYSIQLDNGGFDKAKRLKVPSNIILMFQPPHCPELNPIEQVWQYLKRRFRWSLPTTLDQLRQQLQQRLERLTPQTVASITRRQSILDALSVAGI
jgi:transposase